MSSSNDNMILENPYQNNNQGFVGNLNDDNKYIDNSKKQDPYWMQSGTGPKQSNETVSLGTEKDVNSTFELNFDNPYAQHVENQTIQEENDNSQNPLLQEIGNLSSQISNYSNITSDVSGIGEKKEYEINLNLENASAAVPAVVEEPVTSFLGSTASLPIVDQTQQFPSAYPSLSFNNLPLGYTLKKERQPLSKTTKVLLWTLIPILCVIALFWIIFWAIEYAGATDLVVWQGFDPVTTV